MKKLDKYLYWWTKAKGIIKKNVELLRFFYIKTWINNIFTQAKHLVNKYLGLARFYYQKIWVRNAFYVILIVMITLTIWNRDLVLNLNLTNHQNSMTNDKEEVVEKIVKPARPHPFVNSIFNFDSLPSHLYRHRPSKADTTLANTFSNLGFLLNPGLAKKIKVDARVVALKRKKVKDYVDKFSPIAIEEMKKYGIPASITLAQGLLESNVGDSRLARMNNNHFGIKCFSRTCQKGHCSNYTDDSHKDFFRIYNSAWESYREHSQFLQKERYIHLKKLGTKDYENWAHGLRKAGYATDKKYAYKLIKIIEVLKLYQFDG